MATLQQIEANRLNAQKPTGPRSAEGKAVVRFNALKSGIDAQSQVIPGEDPAALAALAAGYHDRYQPATPASSRKDTIAGTIDARTQVHGNNTKKIALHHGWLRIRTCADWRGASGGPRRLQIGFGRHDQGPRHAHSRLRHYGDNRQTPNRRVDLRWRLNIRKVQWQMEFRRDDARDEADCGKEPAN